jgi:hypothetical protein
MTKYEDWIEVPAAVKLAMTKFAAALCAILGRPGGEMTPAAAVEALRRLAERGAVRMESASGQMRQPIAPSSPEFFRILWQQRGIPLGQTQDAAGGAVVLLNKPDLVAALAAMTPEPPAPETPDVEGVSFLENGQAVADFGAALRAVERYRDAWWWITSGARNPNLAERRWPQTAAAVLQAMLHPGPGRPFHLFGWIDGQWQRLPDTVAPVLADEDGSPIGSIQVKIADLDRLLPVGFPFTALVHHLEELRAEAAKRDRARNPDPEALARAAAEAEERARAFAEEARRRQEVAAAMDRAEERARAERMAAERRRVMNFFAAETARPKPG